MKLSEIVKTISDDCQWLDKAPTDSEIYSIAFIPADETQLTHGILYLGNVEELPDFPIAGISFLCHKNKEFFYHRTEENNVLVFEQSEQYIIRKIFPLFENNFSLFPHADQLLNTFSSGTGVNDLLETAYKISGIPMHVIDTNYRLIAYNSGMNNLNSIWPEAIKTGRLPESRAHLIQLSDLPNALHTYEGLYFMWGYYEKKYFLTSLIYVNNVETGWFAAVVNAEETFKYYHFIRFLLRLVTIEFQMEKYSARSENIMEQIFFKELVEHALSKEQIQNTAQKLGWELSGRYQLLLISDHSNRFRKDILHNLIRPLRKIFRKIYYSFYEEKLVIIIDNPKKDQEEDLDSFRTLLKRYHLISGVSEIYTNLQNTYQAYSHADRSLKHLSDNYKSDSLCCYSECMYTIMYEELYKSCNPTQFYHSGVEEIWLRDQNKGTNWLETLEAYLDHAGNPETAALKLHVHRNTLFYRVNRMQELYHLNLNDGLERMHILLTIKFIKAASETSCKRQNN